MKLAVAEDGSHAEEFNEASAMRVDVSRSTDQIMVAGVECGNRGDESKLLASSDNQQTYNQRGSDAKFGGRKRSQPEN